MRQRRFFSNYGKLFFVLLVTVSYPGYSEQSPFAWQRWEHTLTSSKPYLQPYKEVTLQVNYTGPKGESFTSYGFWEEGNIFKIRSAFPRAGNAGVDTRPDRTMV